VFSSSLIGCATNSSPEPDRGATNDLQPEATVAATPKLELRVAMQDGSARAGDRFDALADVYIDTHFSAKVMRSGAAFTGAEYSFDVVDAGGSLLSTDDAACRSVHVGPDGRIASVSSACAHANVSAAGGLLVQLVPYRRTADANYTVVMTPALNVDGTVSANVMAHPFAINIHVEPVCGNGILESGEACDDGNLVAGDGCDSSCAIEPPPTPVCGNGIVEDGEDCDDGNLDNLDGCDTTCHIVYCCGNGVLEPGEQCDDGNDLAGDGCSASCTFE
jgi:cysteine-rich repeat protein